MMRKVCLYTPASPDRVLCRTKYDDVHSPYTVSRYTSQALAGAQTERKGIFARRKYLRQTNGFSDELRSLPEQRPLNHFNGNRY